MKNYNNFGIYFIAISMITLTIACSKNEASNKNKPTPVNSADTKVSDSPSETPVPSPTSSNAITLEPSITKSIDPTSMLTPEKQSKSTPLSPKPTYNSAYNVKGEITDTNDLTYTNKKIGFTLKFPENWKNKYYLVDTADSSIYVYHKSGLKQDQYFFTISYFKGTIAEWKKSAAKDGNKEHLSDMYYKLGEKNNKIIIYNFSSESIYPASEQGKKALKEFVTLSNDSENILATFKLK